MAIADTAELNVLLRLKDQLSGPTTAATAKIRGLEQAANGATTRGVGNLSSSFDKAGKSASGFGTKLAVAGGRLKGFATGPLGLIGVTGGIIGLGAAIEGGIDSLKRLDDVTAQTNAVLRSTKGIAGENASSIRDLANRYEDLNATIDDKVIQSAENLLLTFTSIRKDAFEPALKAALDMNQAMGGGEAGLQSTVIQLGKALQDPIKGITALRRVGVNFSADQIKTIKGLVDQNKLYDAQQIILKELTTEFGGSFKAAGTTASATFAKLGDTIEDLEASFATALLPGLTSVSKALSDALANPAVQQGITDLGKSFAGLFSPQNVRQAGIIGDQLGTLFKGVQTAWGALPDPLKQLLITGLVVGKVSKILFDFGPLDFVKAGASLASGLGKSLFQRGGTPANPLFVADVAGGLGKGGVPPIAAAGTGLAAPIAATVAILASPLVLSTIARTFNPTNDPNSIFGRTFDPKLSATQQAATGTPTASRTPNFGPANGKLATSRDIDKLEAGIAASATRDTDKLDGATAAGADKIASRVLGLKPQLAELIHLTGAQRKDLYAAAKAAIGPVGHYIAFLAQGTTKAQLTVADKLAYEFSHSQQPFYRSSANAARALSGLESLQKRFLAQGDRKSAAAIGRDIAALRSAVRAGDSHVVSEARKIANSTESQKRKLDDLRSLQRSAIAHGDRHSAAQIAKLITLISTVSHFNPQTGRVTVVTVDPKTGKTTTTQQGPVRRAAGGPVWPGLFSIVGEEGPELVHWKGFGEVKSSRRSVSMLNQFSTALGRMANRPTPTAYRPTEHRPTEHRPTRIDVAVTADVSTANIKRKSTRVRRYGEQFT